ncbi:uncharacterized protein LOC128651694 isoform X1 [Bombina bombina]|uniref:uncharacterized protein LOC128651694 isoform X1 n=1 Tax=Bombina bombina TaxID=8345 RepID=UPI00235AE895|nr:uncharacterized protein LOC128651694 isoform X1 [Bombina bombina]XP_053560657.1 uncharacterized protein LOC128651694 isoform X1 [Bombina bombina]
MKCQCLYPPPPPTQYQDSHGFSTLGMPQGMQSGQAEWSHTSHQWDYQSSMRAPPSASLGRAPPSASLGRAPSSASLGRAPPSSDEHIAEVVPEAPAAEVVPEAPAAEVVPEAPAAEVIHEAPATEVIHEADAAEVVQDAPADRAEPAPRITAAQEPVDPLYSPLGEEYISLQRRLITSCKSIQRGQQRFHRSQERLLKRSIELQRDIAASLNGIVQNQSQMMRIQSDMQMDNRWREQNQLLGVLVEHFTHQQDTASSLSSVASTPAESSEASQTRRTRKSTPVTSAPSSKKPEKK